MLASSVSRPSDVFGTWVVQLAEHQTFTMVPGGLMPRIQPPFFVKSPGNLISHSLVSIVTKLLNKIWEITSLPPPPPPPPASSNHGFLPCYKFGSGNCPVTCVRHCVLSACLECSLVCMQSSSSDACRSTVHEEYEHKLCTSAKNSTAAAELVSFGYVK